MVVEMLQENFWLAQADAKAVRPADHVNDVDHRADRPEEEVATPAKLPSFWARITRGFPWNEARR
jgi:hypothetical protein